MRRLLLPLVVVVLTVFGLPGKVWAQGQKTASIVGQLRIRGLQPNARIEVKLEARFAVAGITYSDMEGKFAFIDLPPNLYHVVVNDEEYEPVRVEAIISSISAQNVLVQIELRPKSKGNATTTAENGPSGGNRNLVDKDALGKEFPKDAVNAFEKGVKLSNEGKADEAIKKFEEAIAIAPSFYQAKNNLGSVLLTKGDYSGAKQQFEAVTKIQQADAAAYFNLGNVYLLTNHANESYWALQEGLKREPGSPKGRFLLGALYSRTGRYAEAEKQLSDVLQMEPTMSQVHLELANLYIRQRNEPMAIMELTTFLSRFPEDPMAPKAKDVLIRMGGKVPRVK
jgi:tetratricopeptide (TPR) repeat protein